MRSILVLIVLGGCATSPPAPAPAPRPAAAVALAPVAPAKPAPDPGPPQHEVAPVREARTVEYADMQLQQISEKQWLVETREKLSRILKVEPAQLLFSPGRQRVAVVRGPPVIAEARSPKKPRPRRFQIVVVGVDGKRPRALRPVTAPASDEPPRDLRFLSDDRLVYEVVASPAAATPRPAKAKTTPAKQKAATPRPAVRPGPPERLFVIQPLGRPARPIRCHGVRFTFTTAYDRLAFVAGTPDAAFVAVDGVQTYPRKGRTIIATDPAWSRDGRSLAFVESRPPGSPRLVLLAEFDNPTGDTTWDLPASATLESTRVSWAGPGKLVVGKSAMKPVFSASFEKEKAKAPGP